MGRDWHWGGKSSKKGRGRGGGGVGTDSTTTSTGCMCAVFQLFDFHQLQIPLNQQQESLKPIIISPAEKGTVPKGIEAPRNSLKSDGSSSLSSIIDEENSLNIPVGIQIKTSRGTKSTDSSETSSSPATKTPTLVARLMGLDLLPETNSPIFNSSTSRITPSPLSKSNPQQRIRTQRQPLQTKLRNYSDNDTGTHSLPETPRISSARRSDVDHHHRLSLQINKENVVSNSNEDLDFSRLLAIRRKFDVKEQKTENESRSPSHYARQIVKQVKESVSRRVGLDITNTVRNRELSRDELISQLQSKKNSKFFIRIANESTPGEQSISSCSPRLRFMDSNKSNKPNSATLSSKSKDQNFQASKLTLSVSGVNVQPHQTIKVSAKPKPQQEQQKQQVQKSQASIQKCRKVGASHDGFGPRAKKQQETFVRPSTAIRTKNSEKKCKKTPLSNNLLNLNVPTLLPVKKSPTPQATKITHKQKPESSDAPESERRSQLSSLQSQKYEREVSHDSHVLNTRDTNYGDTSNCATTSTTGDGGAELKQYISYILSRTGIEKNTRVPFTKWFSPTHPLDPSIFHLIENANIYAIYLYSSQLKNRGYRKLIFHLVDDMLVQILKPYIHMKPWVVRTLGSEYCLCSNQMRGSQLTDTLCLRIQSFPCADCKVLEDIDELIDKDLPDLKLQSAMAFEDGAECLVKEIEDDILDTLVHETALFLGVTHL